MRVLSTLLLAGVVAAVSPNAKVYIFSDSSINAAAPQAALSAPEARLVLARRAGLDQFSDIDDVSENALAAIGTYGGPQHSLIVEYLEAQPKQLIVMAEGWGADADEKIRRVWNEPYAAFEFTQPPSSKYNQKLAADMRAQSGDTTVSCTMAEELDAFNKRCWSTASKVMHMTESDLSNFLSADIQQSLHTLVDSSTIDFTLVAMPPSRTAKSSALPYGIYDMPSTRQSKRQVEEPMRDFLNNKIVSTPNAPATIFKSNSTLPKGIPSFCHSSLDSCVSATGNCSGHGECKQKYKLKDEKDVCFTCMCTPDWNGKQTTYWGGAACSKVDVSSQFWLIATFTIAIVGLVGWAIGMLFSIGEEKLPGVIGAGVSGPKASR